MTLDDSYVILNPPENGMPRFARKEANGTYTVINLESINEQEWSRITRWIGNHVVVTKVDLAANPLSDLDLACLGKEKPKDKRVLDVAFIGGE